MAHEDVRVVIAKGMDGTDGFLFQRPEAVLVANQTSEILPVLSEVQRATDNGKCAAGFLTY